MGRRRGQRNRSREKFWPGQDAAEVRAFHESQGNDELRKKHDFQEPVAPAPIKSLTHNEIAKLQPESDVALAVRRASAEGTYVLPQIKRHRLAVGWRSSSEGPRLTVKELLGEFHWDKIGRAHYLILLLQATNHYALPQFMHECDPEEIMMIAERMDLWKATVQRMYRKSA